MRASSSNKLEGSVKWKLLWWFGWGLIITLGIALGSWQWQRADEKQQYLDRLANAPTLYNPSHEPQEGAQVHLEGHFLAEETRFLDNRVYQSRHGVAVLTPLVDRQGRWWLVERGFLPTGPRRNDPVFETPEGRVEIYGQWQSSGQRGPLFGPNEEGRRLQHIDLSVWSPQGRFAHSGWLHQEGGEGHYTSWWTANVLPPSRHRGYAFQWWGLALAAAIVMCLGLRGGSRRIVEKQ